MTFDEAFQKLIGHEGGYVWHEKDPGGETKFGISKRSYPNEDIAQLTLERAKEIYLQDYWSRAGCDKVPELLKFDLFDMAVNQGIAPAIKALQHACGETEDGVIGQRTLLALQSVQPARLLFKFDAARLVRYSEASDTQWGRFGRGWIRRVAANMSAAEL